MKKLIALAFLLAATPAYSDITHSITSSIKLTVGGDLTSASKVGTSYSVSGTGVDTTYTSDGSAVSNGVGSLTISDGIGSIPTLTVTQDDPSNSFSFSQSFEQGDAIPTSAVTTGESANFSTIISTAGGTAGDLAGTITTSGDIEITAGGANTEAVGQVITQLDIN